MDFLPDLPFAGGDDDAVRAMEVQALRIPRQTDEVEHPPGPGLLIVDQRLVRHLEERRLGKQRTPVIHDA